MIFLTIFLQTAIKFMIITDLVLSCLLLVLGGNYGYIGGNCSKCGKNFVGKVFSIFIWQMMTHRCDDNLVQ